jgi:predicted MFS family arabinose efflux permease
MSTRFILFALAFIQFNHIVDFMIIMPLGTQIMREFATNAQGFGLLVSAYAISAGLAGFAGSFFVDQFDRKRVLLTAVFFFSLSTFACGLSNSYWVLFLFRSLSGLFGGIIGSQILSITGDLFPLEKRSSALGIIMSAFSVASVAGVPLGLLIAARFSWNTPFLFLGGFSLLGLMMASIWLPPLNSHRNSQNRSRPLDTLRGVIKFPNRIRALFLMLLVQFGQFTVIPFIAPYYIMNLGFSEKQISLVYFCGGIATFFTARLIGRMADRWGRKIVLTWLVLISIAPLIILTQLNQVSLYLALMVSTVFMIFGSGRLIPVMTLITSTVPARERGGFMSLNTTVQMMGSGLAAWVGSQIITEEAGRLVHYDIVGYIAAFFSLIALVVGLKIREIS